MIELRIIRYTFYVHHLGMESPSRQLVYYLHCDQNRSFKMEIDVDKETAKNHVKKIKKIQLRADFRLEPEHPDVPIFLTPGDVLKIN